MSGVSERTVAINGHDCRIWEKGAGEPLFYLAGFGGLPRWTPFLDRIAAHRRVVAPSLPGFPGSSGHDELDTSLDWIAATLDLLDAAGFGKVGLDKADLVGASVGGAGGVNAGVGASVGGSGGVNAGFSAGAEPGGSGVLTWVPAMPSDAPDAGARRNVPSIGACAISGDFGSHFHRRRIAVLSAICS